MYCKLYLLLTLSVFKNKSFDLFCFRNSLTSLFKLRNYCVKYSRTKTTTNFTWTVVSFSSAVKNVENVVPFWKCQLLWGRGKQIAEPCCILSANRSVFTTTLPRREMRWDADYMDHCRICTTANSVLVSLNMYALRSRLTKCSLSHCENRRVNSCRKRKQLGFCLQLVKSMI